MSNLYEKFHTLFSYWLSTEEEDKLEFEEWIKDKEPCLYLNGRLLSQDIKYINPNNIVLLENPQNALITSTTDYIQITTNTSGEKKVNIPFEFDSTTNCFVEWTYVSGGTVQPMAFSINNDTLVTGGYFSYDGTSFNFSLGSSSSTLSRTVDDGDTIKIVRYDEVTEVYHNNLIIYSISKTFSGKGKFGFYTNNGRVQRLKNIKVGTL